MKDDLISVEIFKRFKSIPNYFICPNCEYTMFAKDYKRNNSHIHIFCTNHQCIECNQIYEYKIPLVDMKFIGINL